MMNVSTSKISSLRRAARTNSRLVLTCTLLATIVQQRPTVQDHQRRVKDDKNTTDDDGSDLTLIITLESEYS